MDLPWGDKNIMDGFVTRICSMVNTDRNTYEWIEYLCPVRMQVVDRKMISFNTNIVNDIHQMHTRSKNAPKERLRFTPFKHRKNGESYI